MRREAKRRKSGAARARGTGVVEGAARDGAATTAASPTWMASGVTDDANLVITEGRGGVPGRRRQHGGAFAPRG